MSEPFESFRGWSLLESRDPAFRLGSLPPWLNPCLLFMASSFSPLTSALRSSTSIHKASFAAVARIPMLGSSVPGQRWVGGEGGRGHLLSGFIKRKLNINIKWELTIYGHFIWKISPAVGRVKKLIMVDLYAMSVLSSLCVYAYGCRVILNNGNDAGPSLPRRSFCAPN